ncbi:MAG TPA: 50S ribosomal protein L18 [Solirubrobacteraceae bacterium]|nr:50S ribosomal protein L18 [Solirubrobacteraceae bacterium]
MSVSTRSERRLRRRRRVRAKVSGDAQRPRVSVFRSNRGISAQLVDDSSGRTLAAVHWYEQQLRALAGAQRTARAGALLAERAKQQGIERAVFDRGGYPYHGNVRVLAEALRENGITI